MIMGTIEYEEIQNPLQIMFSNRILDSINYNGYRIIGTIDNKKLEKKIIEKGIDMLKKQKKYILFKYGCIYEEYKKYIIDNKIEYLEVSRYPDGWYSCLPLVDIYSLYKVEETKIHYMKIIHNSMFARISENEYIRDWYLLIGNIP